MDRSKAEKLFGSIKGKILDGYIIESFINNGKSAAVFKGRNSVGQTFALKIFDNDIIEKFGYEIQEKRILQEIQLVGHSIPGLISIIDGNKVELDTNLYYFIVMEFIDGVNLKEYIQSNDYGNDFIIKVTKSIYYTSEALLEHKLAHRDIKPENIMISKTGDVILMDLGVLKLIGNESFSDVYEKQFMGTLRYGPPEFITRNEEDNYEGWRAVNLYQIGCTMHDLIMKEELFENEVPYPNLVIAIKEKQPLIINDSLPHVTCQLARDMMAKVWKSRLRFCSKQRMLDYFNYNFENPDELSIVVDRIKKFTNPNKTKLETILSLESDNRQKAEKATEISKAAQELIQLAIIKLKSKALFSGFEQSAVFNRPNDISLVIKERAVSNVVYMIKEDLSYGLSRPLFLFFQITNDYLGMCKIKVIGAFLITNNNFKLERPLVVINLIDDELNPNKGKYPAVGIPIKVDDKMATIFDGVIQLDSNIDNVLGLKLSKLILKGLEAVKHEVEFKLDRKASQAENQKFKNREFELKTLLLY